MRRAVYEIAVENPETRHGGVTSAWLDGETVDPGAIPLVDDGRRHVVRVVRIVRIVLRGGSAQAPPIRSVFST